MKTAISTLLISSVIAEQLPTNMDSNVAQKLRYDNGRWLEAKDAETVADNSIGAKFDLSKIENRAETAAVERDSRWAPNSSRKLKKSKAKSAGKKGGSSGNNKHGISERSKTEQPEKPENRNNPDRDSSSSKSPHRRLNSRSSKE